jgi:hypothetical protein
LFKRRRIGHSFCDFRKMMRMPAVRPIAIAALAAIALIGSHGLVVAQTSMGGPEPLPPPLAPTPPPASPPKLDYIPPSLAPTPPGSNQPSTSTDFWWGAIGFTADGSYSSVWKMASRAEAEAKVAKQCAAFGRGGCEVVSFSGQECVALSTFIGSYRRRRWNLSFTAGGTTYPEAQNAAMGRCNSDERSQGRCQPRTAACADGR